MIIKCLDRSFTLMQVKGSHEPLEFVIFQFKKSEWESLRHYFFCKSMTAVNKYENEIS